MSVIVLLSAIDLTGTARPPRFLRQKSGPDAVKVYKWAGKNDPVALCESDYISFGGG